MLWRKVPTGLVLGAIAGAIVGPAAEDCTKPVGSLIINLIKMLIVPLNFVSLVAGATSMEDIH